MPTATALSNREVVDLFKSWGFEEGEGNGGHLVMRYHDKRVQVTAPGRSTPTPQTALRKAALAVGVPLAEFRRGPTKSKKAPAAKKSQPPPPSTRTTRTTLADVKAAMLPESPPPSPEPSPEPASAPESPMQIVLALLESQPYRVFRRDDIERNTGLSPVQISNALSYIKKNRADQVRCLKRGHWQWNTQLEQQAREEEQRRRLEAQREAARLERLRLEDEARQREAAARMFEKVADDIHGRVVLRDSAGELWVAIRIEPGFHAMPTTPVVESRANGTGFVNQNGSASRMF